MGNRGWSTLLTRLVVAALYTFGLKRGVGLETLSEFFTHLHLETQVGRSPSALGGVMQALEAAMLETTAVWEQEGVATGEMREIIGAGDEPFLQRMMLVFMSSETLLGELSQRSVVQALFGAGSGGYPGIHRVQLYLGSLCHFMIEVTLPTLGLLCHHEDDGAQAIGCLVHRLAPALRVRPPRTVTRCKQCVLGCPIPASTHVDLATWISKEAR